MNTRTTHADKPKTIEDTFVAKDPNRGFIAVDLAWGEAYFTQSFDHAKIWNSKDEYLRYRLRPGWILYKILLEPVSPV